jgi:hypothetical protein
MGTTVASQPAPDAIALRVEAEATGDRHSDDS